MKSWSDFFFIRLADDIGYYVAWKGTKDNAFKEHYFRTHDNARKWAIANWREQIDTAFEKEILGGSESSETNNSSED